MAGRRLEALMLMEAERSELTGLAARPKTAQALAQRARIILACAAGLENKVVSRQLGVPAMTVGKWRRRCLDQRVARLRDEPRSGAPRTIDDARLEAVITRTLESQPDDATHWSSRGMARDSGLSVSTVQRIWRAFGLKPHRRETFKRSTDPDFITQVRDVVGLYVAPPEHALCWAWMRRRRSRRSIVARRCFRCGPASRSGAAMTTPGMGRHPCSPPWISPPAR
jgi:transposase